MRSQPDRTAIAEKVAALPAEQLPLLALYLRYLQTGDPVLRALATAPEARTASTEPARGEAAGEACPHPRRVLLDWTIGAWADLELLEPGVKERVLRGVRRFVATGQGHLERVAGGWQLELAGHRLLLRYEAEHHRLLVVAVTRDSGAQDHGKGQEAEALPETSP
ncbi:MAG: hypothetical protein DIU70_004155 [Bacillota bacterium]|nr:MAG: hypothetical protein DIU70_08310 [Bacillota bacterium]